MQIDKMDHAFTLYQPARSTKRLNNWERFNQKKPVYPCKRCLKTIIAKPVG